MPIDDHSRREFLAGAGVVAGSLVGNDDIMVTLTVPPDSAPRLRAGTLITRLTRDGFRGDRLLVTVKVADLAPLLNAYPIGDPGLEHVFDY